MTLKGYRPPLNVLPLGNTTIGSGVMDPLLMKEVQNIRICSLIYCAKYSILQLVNLPTKYSLIRMHLINIVGKFL